MLLTKQFPLLKILRNRHIVQKKLNDVIQDNHASVLPIAFENWDSFSVNIQENVIKVNYFFCGLHFFVGLAYQTKIALMAQDKFLIID